MLSLVVLCCAADYPLLNSWMIGRDVNVPGPFPSRVVGCDGGFSHAPEAALFPAVISNEGPAYGDITRFLQHFVAYVLGANCIQQLPNSSTATAGWDWGQCREATVSVLSGATYRAVWRHE